LKATLAKIPPTQPGAPKQLLTRGARFVLEPSLIRDASVDTTVGEECNIKFYQMLSVHAKPRVTQWRRSGRCPEGDEGLLSDSFGGY
jgi:hypothetical protein